MKATHAVILAGGLGTRISTLLGDVPKALATVGGRPFLEWKVNELTRNGITSATLLLGHGSAPITELLSTWQSKGRSRISLEVALDGPRLLGTGGALKQHIRSLPETFYLTYGDNLLDLPYQELQQMANQFPFASVIAVTDRIGSADTLNCLLCDGKVARHNKSGASEFNTLDYGVMLLQRQAVEAAAAQLNGPFDLSLILEALAEQGDLVAVMTRERYWEIGTPESLERLRDHVSTLAEQEVDRRR